MGPYDAVLLATPLEYSGIQLHLLDSIETKQSSSVQPQNNQNELKEGGVGQPAELSVARQYHKLLHLCHGADWTCSKWNSSGWRLSWCWSFE